MDSEALQSFFFHTKSIQRELQQVLDNRSKPDWETGDYLKYQLDVLQNHSILLSNLENENILMAVVSKLRKVFNLLCQEQEEPSNNYRASKERKGQPGPPKLNISEEQLEYFFENGFNCVDISNMLGVSLSTVRHRMSDFSILTSKPFYNISDDDLSKVISEIKEEWPRSGYRMVQGFLRAKGMRIPQQRVRTIMRQIDPIGTVARWSYTVKRRVYSVSGPNALWHIDGNHKLIRYDNR